MGLDVYFHKVKVKPSAGIDVNNVEDLYNYHNELVKTNFVKTTNKLIKKIDKVQELSERTDLITQLREYVKEIFYYDWYWETITPELTNKELKEKITQLQTFAHPHEDVYFRKANFVYAFFHPYLVDEECVVTKEMVKDLLKRCKKVLNAAKKDKVFGDNPESDFDKYYYQYPEGETWLHHSAETTRTEDKRIAEEIAKTGTRWIETAEAILPTQSGFFFGSTDYTVYYVKDVYNCYQQFSKLLKNWKRNEYVYNIMSW